MWSPSRSPGRRTLRSKRNSPSNIRGHLMKALRLTLIAALLSGTAQAADVATIDWTRVPAKTLTLFYPGQSTFQWLRGPNHPGAALVAQNGACATCHNGQEAKLGDKIVKGGPLEPTPPKRKNGSL